MLSFGSGATSLLRWPVSLHVVRDPRVTVDDVLDRGRGPVVIGCRVDADPHLGRVDVDHLIAEHGAADVSADVADAGDRTQLGTDATGDAAHFRLRCAGPANQLDEQVALFEGRQRRAIDERQAPQAEDGQNRKASPRDAAARMNSRQRRVVAAFEPGDERRTATRGRVGEQDPGQRRGDRQRDEHRDHERHGIGHRQRPEQLVPGPAHEVDRQDGEQQDQRRIDDAAARLERRREDHVGGRMAAVLLRGWCRRRKTMSTPAIAS